MPLHLRPMQREEMAGWLVEHHREYVESRVASGEPEEIAEENGASSMARLFPAGAPARGHSVFVLVETRGDVAAGDAAAGEAGPALAAAAGDAGAADSAAGDSVGSLWVGPYPDGRPDGMWVWSVAVDEAHRGRGLGRAAMLLAEDEARRRSATEIGLNVFGFNDVALGLYRSLDYETAAVQMRKVLS